MKKIRETLLHQQNELMNYCKFAAILILAASCQSNKQANENIRYVEDFIEFLRHNEVDSTTLAQPFFNEKFRSNNNPYNSYVVGLQQMKVYLQSSHDIEINADNSDSGIYILSAEVPNDSSRIYLLVRNDGIESFSPLFKGKEIVGWM